jgi:hypothetical protein
MAFSQTIQAIQRVVLQLQHTVQQVQAEQVELRRLHEQQDGAAPAAHAGTCATGTTGESLRSLVRSEVTAALAASPSPSHEAAPDVRTIVAAAVRTEMAQAMAGMARASPPAPAPAAAAPGVQVQVQALKAVQSEMAALRVEVAQERQVLEATTGLRCDQLVTRMMRERQAQWASDTQESLATWEAAATAASARQQACFDDAKRKWDDWYAAARDQGAEALETLQETLRTLRTVQQASDKATQTDAVDQGEDQGEGQGEALLTPPPAYDDALLAPLAPLDHGGVLSDVEDEAGGAEADGDDVAPVNVSPTPKRTRAPAKPRAGRGRGRG